MKSECGSFCWNYVTNTFYGNYSGDNVFCIYAGFEVVLCYRYVGESFSYNFACNCLCWNYAVRSFAALMQVTVSAANMWVTIFIVIMQIEVCCNYAGGIHSGQHPSKPSLKKLIPLHWVISPLKMKADQLPTFRSIPPPKFEKNLTPPPPEKFFSLGHVFSLC